MTSLSIVAALAAQTAMQSVVPPASAPTASPETVTPARSVGESTYVDLEAGAGYSTNPLFSVGSSNGSGFGRISAHAVHSSVTDRTTTVFSALGQSVFYATRYGSAQSFDLNGRHDAAVNEKLRVFVDGDVAYDRGGQLDTRILSVPNVPLLPGATVPPPLLAPGSDFLNVTGKTYRAVADVGGQLALGPQAFLEMSGGVQHTVFKNGPFDSRYTAIPLSIGYDRQLNERATVGARVAAQFSHYSGDILDTARNVRVITPELTGQLRLSEQMTFSGDIGASFSSVDTVTGTRHSTGVTADANLCSAGERSHFCGRASIQQQAATSAGPARVVSVGMDYSRQLSAYDTLQLSLSGERFSNPLLLVSVPTFSHATYVRAAADYSKRIGNRLFGGVNVSARKLTQKGPDPDADFSATLFVRYRLGDVR